MEYGLFPIGTGSGRGSPARRQIRRDTKDDVRQVFGRASRIKTIFKYSGLGTQISKKMKYKPTFARKIVDLVSLTISATFKPRFPFYFPRTYQKTSSSTYSSIFPSLYLWRNKLTFLALTWKWFNNNIAVAIRKF